MDEVCVTVCYRLSTGRDKREREIERVEGAEGAEVYTIEESVRTDTGNTEEYRQSHSGVLSVECAL